MSAQGKAPWFRFFSSDFLSWTRTMKAGDTGVFVTLLAMLHERGEPLPYDAARLARFCNTTKPALENAVSRLRADGLLSIDGGNLWSDIIERECEFREEKSQKAKSAANMRHEKSKKNQRHDDADAMPTRGRGIVRRENPLRGFSPDIGQRSGLDNRGAESETDEHAPSSRLEGATGVSENRSDGNTSVFSEDDDPAEFLRSIKKDITIGAATSKAAKKLTTFLASAISHPDVARADLTELLKNGHLTWHTAQAALYRICDEFGAEFNAKKA